MKLNLEEPGDKSPFKVPEDYFENLNSRMNQIIDEHEREDAEAPEVSFYVKEPGRMEKFRPILYMAAMFVVLLFSINTIMKYTTADREKAESKLYNENSTTYSKQEVTAEDYVINAVGTYAITEYYIDPEYFE